MSTIYWLASYPKSGNTWMRALLTNYLSESDEPADINMLNTGPIASSRAIFDEFIGVESSDLTQEEIEAWRPDVYKRIASEFKPPFFIKVHDAFTYYGNQALIPQEATAGVLYFLRNPLDVAVSFAHHCVIPVEESIRRMADRSYTFVANKKRLGDQLNQRLLTWSDHVISWVDAPEVRVLLIRYEDLLLDTNSVFADVVRFCGLHLDEGRIRKAVEFSSFEQLARQEKELGFGEKAPNATSFFRKGKIGSWTEQLTEEQVTRIVDVHRDVMRRFGYLDDMGVPIF